MLRNKLFLTVLFSLIVLAGQAQNKFYDWGFSLNGSLYSYSAMEESKMSSPYEYNRGTQISLSKYLNNNFDLEFQAGLTTTRYFTGMVDFEYTYANTRLYDGSFNLKYKLDNGYIIKKENFLFSPYLKVGLGTNYIDYRGAMDISIPAGAGFSIGMGNRMSFVFESNYKYNLIASNAYVTHSVGLKFNFGEANKKRLVAQRKRDKQRKLARIEKYRSKKDRSEKETLASVLGKDNEEEVTNSLIEEVPEETTIVEPTPVAEPVAPGINDKPTIVKSEEEDTFSASKVQLSSPVDHDKSIDVAPSTSLAADKAEKEIILPKPSPTPVKVADEYCVNSAKVLTEFGRDITFDVNSTSIRSRMHSSLNEVINVMNKCESTKFVILSHTDKDGDADYNTKLAEKRAAAVKAYLVKNGINADRLATLAIGEYGASSGDKSSDRRISFKINKTSF